MRRRELTRDPVLSEILQDRKRTKALFREGTNENVKNYDYPKALADLYVHDKEYFDEFFSGIAEFVETYLDEHSSKYSPGFIKVPIGFSSKKRDIDFNINLGEPKMKKHKKSVVVTEIKKPGKENKNALW
jgi:hypothetical protein